MAKTYTPVGWEDGVVKTPAMANLQTGEVTPAEVEGGTLVCAENLKHMDDAIKDLYDEGTTSKDIVIGDETEVTEDTKIFIDTGELGNLGSEVVNSLDGNESYLAPSVRIINKLHTYSLEEQIIGTWFGKPLYRRGMAVGRVNPSTSENKSHNIENIDKKVKIYATDVEGGNTLPYYTGDSRYSASVGNFNTTTFQLITGSATTLYNLIVFFEYTKTTDTSITLTLSEVTE